MENTEKCDNCQDEEIHTSLRVCKEKDCDTIPTYGKIGSSVREYCKVHKPETYVNLVYKCAHNGCNVRPCFAKEDSVIPEFCKEHMKIGYINVINNKCKHPSCTIGAKFGKPGSKANIVRHIYHQMIMLTL
jgi:hypothetical protein